MIVKNVSSPYIIHTLDRNDPIILDAGNIIVNGNLNVLGTGTVTTIDSVNTLVYDNIVEYNAGYTINPPDIGLTSGISIFRGNTRPEMQLLWFEGSDPPGWRLSYETSTTWPNTETTFDRVFNHITYYDPDTGYRMTRVADDETPALGGNLDIGNLSLYSTNVSDEEGNTWTANIKIDSNVSLQKYPLPINTSITPDYITLTASNVRSGGTGLYVTTDEQNIVHEELITKKRAIVFSIIF